MNGFIFKASATMKEYNAEKYWIDGNIVPEYRTPETNLKKALEEWRGWVKDHTYIEISENAMRNREAMYKDGPEGDPVQIGYVITAKSEFATTEHGGPYVNLWVEIIATVKTIF